MALAHNPRIVTDGLILALDAANPKSYSGSGTTWTDLSGNGNNGTIYNSPTYDGESFTFLNASAQRVGIPYKPEWRLVGSNTISFWSNGNPSSAYCAIGYQKSSWRGYNISADRVLYSGTDGSNDISASITKGTNEWCLLTWVIDRTAGFYYVYKNDTLTHTVPINQPDLSSFSNGELTIGGNGTITSRYYTGSISGVVFYTKALLEVEVSQNYRSLKGRYGL